MKTKLLISIICACSLFQAQAQVFPESDAIWNIHINWKEHYYGLSGDTTINNIVYQKLYLLNDTTLVIDSGDEYIGGFRQEEKRVWFRPNLPDDYISYDYPQYPEETLLYDFSKNERDTIWHNIIPNNSSLYYWDIGDSISASIIESIEIDQGVKVYHTSQYVNSKDGELAATGRIDRWVEGIGSKDHGLFWFLNLLTVGGFPSLHLACFKQGNEVKYMDNPYYCNSCFYWSSSNVAEINNASLEVVCENNYIRIKGESSTFPCELKLFSLTGQLISEKILQSGKEEIPINQKGVFLYQVRKNEEIVKTGKIIIK